jgi:predicted CXXCH cytochrome family protein
MPKHIRRLLLLLLGFLVFAYAGIVFLTDPSFYRYGFFRADVVPQLTAGEPEFRGPGYCQACHADRHAEWSAGAHVKVKCEVCHGPAGRHPANGKLPIPADPAKLCSNCHEAMPARPDNHPQIVVSEHPYPHETPIDCSNCHNPHAPGIGAPAEVVVPTDQVEALQLPAPARAPQTGPRGETGIPLSASACVSCHGVRGEGVGAFPALAGIDVAEFVRLMNGYKTGAVQSPMMETIARGLSDDEIRELANYYGGLAGGE